MAQAYCYSTQPTCCSEESKCPTPWWFYIGLIGVVAFKLIKGKK